MPFIRNHHVCHTGVQEQAEDAKNRAEWSPKRGQQGKNRLKKARCAVSECFVYML